MGIFIRNKEKKDVFWKKLTSTEGLQKALFKAPETMKVFFKHSTRCGTSIMAMKTFESSWEDTIEAELYYIDVLRQRAVSDELAMRFGIRHESPQVVVIQNNEVIYHASHGEINARGIKKEIK